MIGHPDGEGTLTTHSDILKEKLELGPLNAEIVWGQSLPSAPTHPKDHRFQPGKQSQQVPQPLSWLTPTLSTDCALGQETLWQLPLPLGNP